MAVNIVTGMTGVAHITSDDDRAKNASIFGKGKYVLDYGKKFEATILSNNQIRIRDGMCINQGTQMGIELNDYEDVVIENGVSGSNRNDLIVMRYARNSDTSMENASLVVIKGTAGSSEDPSYTSGNILDGGELIDDMPLFRVKIESLTITAVEPLFDVFDYSTRKELAGLSNVDNTADKEKKVLSASKLQNATSIGSATNPVYFNSSGVPVAGTYTLGAACAKGVSTSVISGDMNLVTADAVSSAIYNATNYEEGTWTPQLYVARLSAPGKTGPWEEVSSKNKKGYYRKAGDIVVLSAYLYCEISDKSYMEIRGLPFSLGQASYTGTPKCMPIVATLQEAEVGSIGGTTGIKPTDTPVMASGASYTQIIFQKTSLSSAALMFEAIYHTA